MRAIVGGYTPPKKTRTNLPLPVVGYESATISLARPRADALTPREESGAEGSRTLDLLNAIQALSQLSYGPTGGKTGGGVYIATLAGGSTRCGLTALRQVAARVDRRAVDAHLVVEVRPGGAARGAD